MTDEGNEYTAIHLKKHGIMGWLSLTMALISYLLQWNLDLRLKQIRHIHRNNIDNNRRLGV